MTRHKPDYKQLQGEMDVLGRRQLERLQAGIATEFLVPPADPGYALEGQSLPRWPGLSEERVEEAQRRENELSSLVVRRYEAEVRPLHGNPGHSQAWAAFKAWREAEEEAYSTQVFGNRTLKPPHFHHLRAPIFEEDRTEQNAFVLEEHLAAESAGLGPHRVRLPHSLQRFVSSNPLPETLAAQYSRALDACDWRFVFHVTRLKALPRIAVFGLLEGAVAAHSAGGSIERGTRQQRHVEKEFLASNSVCSSFFPPFWTFAKLGGEENTAILAIDAKAVCLERGTIFSPVPVSDGTVSIDDLHRNDSEAGLAAFERCWEDDRPWSEGWGPSASGPEIWSDYVHPRRIRAVIFRSAAARDEWFPAYQETAAENYDDVEVDAFVERIPVGRREFTFPSLRKGRRPEPA